MNLYLHFPFCRSKCAYCALASRGGSKPAERATYAERIAREIAALPPPGHAPHTIYLGGGTPALAPLAPVLDVVRAKGLISGEHELTVELHPLDATAETISLLRAGGVNCVSIGVQTFNDEALTFLNRRHDASDAIAAIAALRSAFPSVGIDLIAGLPHPQDLGRIADALPSLNHVSVYTLIREPGTRLDLDAREGRVALPDDAAALTEFSAIRALLDAAGFVRYEISNFARPGFERRHNLAVWRGEDYIGLGDGACGRRGLARTFGANGAYQKETLPPEKDAMERAIFSLRTSDGLDPDRAAARWPALAPRIPAWRDALAFHVGKGLLSADGSTYRLTRRGAEVCDSILADLV